MKLPLGTFTRSRRDWNVEGLKYSAGSSNGTDNQYTVIYSLNNNDKAGTPLAVYQILAWHTGPTGTMVAFPIYGLQGNPSNIDSMLKPDAGLIAGYCSVQNNTSSGEITNGLVFKADGSTWLGNLDSPLFIIPVNWRLCVVEWAPVGQYTGPSLSAITFLYGEYKQARSRH